MIGLDATQKNPLVMVYFIGGCTYSEIASLRFLAKQLSKLIMRETFITR